MSVPRDNIGWLTATCLSWLLFSGIVTAPAAIIFSDDFNRSPTNNTTVGSNWVEMNTGLGDAALATNLLVLKNGATGGRSWVSQSGSNFINPYLATLNQNADLVTWNFNLRSSRGGFNSLSGFNDSQYGIAFVLAASSSDFLNGNGYAVAWGQSGLTPLRLVRFDSGLANNSTLTDLIAASTAPFNALAQEYLSVRVIYDPATEVWELWGRNDGSSSFADPNTGTFTLLGQATNNSYTGTALGYLGALWNYNTTLNQYAYFDNFSVDVAQRPPSITTQPQSLLATLGGAAVSTVIVSGARPLFFHWYFNGVLMSGQTNAALTIDNFQFSDEGGYSVVASNSFGSVTSVVAALTVNRDFGDVPMPYSTLLADNGARHLSVPGILLGNIVDGETNGQPGATATGDDLNGSNDDDGVVFTSRLAVGQGATLDVLASTNGFLSAWIDFNQNGSWADSGEQVFTNYIVAPGVNHLSLLVPGSAVAGTNAYGRFRFSSVSGLSYTGQAVDGEVEDYQLSIDSPADLSVAISASPDPVAVGSNLTYTIIVTNRGPSQASGVWLTNRLPTNVSFVSASSSQGSCANAGGLVTCNLASLLSGFRATVSIVGVPTSAATVTNSTSVGANENDPNTANNGVTLATVVKDRPVITSQPATVTLTNGATVNFSVAASGTGTLLYQWRFNGSPFIGKTNTALSISNAQPSNAGNYDVVVSDQVGYAVSAPATLTVLVPPSLASQPLSQTGNIGGYITFSVVPGGTQPFSYQWYFNTTNTLNGATAAALTVTNLQTTNAGNYTVAIANSAGVITSAVAVLTIKSMDFGDAPATYATLLASNGARHILLPGIYLGTNVSADSEGKTNATASADDFDDGVTFTNALVAGQTGWVKVVTSTNGSLSAWIDFNQNGNWSEGYEQIFGGQAVVKGTNVLSFEVPYFIPTGSTFARFRFTTSSNAISFDGLALDGEVEDYPVTISGAVATQLVMGTQPPAFATAGAAFDPSPQVYVADNRGNPVYANSSTAITAARLGGGGTLQGTLTATADHGAATFANLFHTNATNITIKFTAGSLSVTSSLVEVDAAVASRLAFKTAPPNTATAGAVFSPQPVIRVEDVYGNLNTDDNGRLVTASRNSGTGTLQGTLTVQTTNGLASFSGLNHLVANTITIDFAAAGLSAVTSGNTVINPATADRIVFTTQPGSAVAGAAFGVQPVVKTRDPYGNNSTVGLTSGKNVTLTLTSGTGPLQGTTALDIGASSGNGTVTFANLRIDVTGTNKQLTASATSLSSGTSGVFTVSAAPFAKLQLLVPGETAAPGTTSGKTGTPDTQVTDAPFSLTVNAVDTNWNVVNSISDMVGITSSDTNATLPATAPLIVGTRTFPFTFNTSGAQTVTAADVSDAAKTTNISPTITVNAAPYTAATGGSATSADTAGGAYTNLTGPVYQEAAAGNISTGTVAMVCPSGFVFDTNAPLPAVKLEGATGGNNHLINNAANGSTQAVSSVTSSQVVFTVASASSSTTTKLTWQNLRVRPTSGAPLARGNIAKAGTATMAGVGTNSNFGTLREISGSARLLTIQSQPSAMAIAGAVFTPQPAVGVSDQFGNLRSTANGNADNSAVVMALRASGSGTLQGNLSATASDGVATFSNLSHQVANTITINFTSGSLSNIASTPVVVNPGAADRLLFAQQPGLAGVGSVFGVQPIVITRDAFGNNSAAGLPANLTVLLTLTSGAGSLLGTASKDIGTAAGNGTATFTDLRIDLSGTNKQLTATAPALASATCSIFSVTGAPPVIITQPQNQNVFVGNNAIFTVSATGEAPLNYQWLFNGGGISGATGTNLALSNVQSGDAGNYSVIVSNLGGSVTSTTAVLRVLTVPRITDITLDGEVLKLSFTTDAGANYFVEYKASLSDPTWLSLTNLAGNGAVMFITDDVTAALTRVYRVRVP